MATTRRRTHKSTAHANLPQRRPRNRSFVRAITSPAAKLAFVTIGACGLAALAVAMMGPQRFRRQIVVPVRGAVNDQADRLWTDSRPLREQLGRLIDRLQSEASREKLVRSFQSWIGHFKAT